MANPINILVVDDSSVYRLAIRKLFDDNPHYSVVGAAQNGEVALAKLKELKVDVVLLDVQMPVMDGIETLRQIRKRDPDIFVIMFSSITTKAAQVTLDALSLGANDYVLKPSGERAGKAGTMESFYNELTAKISALVGTSLPTADSPKSRSLTPKAQHLMLKPKVIAVGSSTGGPLALEKFLAPMQGHLMIPVVIAQHMPPIFTIQLAKYLSNKLGMDVREGVDGSDLEAGKIYIAPGDYHMVVAKKTTAGYIIHTNQKPPENNCRPAVDMLFRSVAEVFGKFALAVQLTGMGQDGMRGAEMIVAKGGEVMAQDKTTATVWSMPGSVVEKGLASEVLPPEKLAAEILIRFMGSRNKTTS